LKFSIQATMTIASIFGALCLAGGIHGLLSLDGITDPVQLSDAKGFAWFWMFLGCVGVAIAIGSWWIARGMKPEQDA